MTRFASAGSMASGQSDTAANFDNQLLSDHFSVEVMASGAVVCNCGTLFGDLVYFQRHLDEAAAKREREYNERQAEAAMLRMFP